MSVGRAARRADRHGYVAAAVGAEHADAALDILELAEYAWHDCYGEVTPPDDVIEDILTCSRGDLARFAAATRLAVLDHRDLKLRAQAVRSART